MADAAMREIAPGLWHWTAPHPRIHLEVSSYYLLAERVLLDPMEPPEGLCWPGSRELGFVPDQLMDDPERTKDGLRGAYRRLLELDFDRLLLAHGEPLAAGGKDALRRFVAQPR